MATRYSPKTGLPNNYQTGPYDVAHWYLQWGGKLPGNESWSCGLRLTPTSGTAPEVIQSMCDAAAAAVSTYHASATACIHGAATLNIVKLNNVDTTGHQPQGVTIQKILPDVPGGAGSQGSIPANQVAMVISLTTGFSRGPAHRGRFYLPLPCYNLDASGRFAAANAAAVGTTTDTFIAAINAISAVMEVSVMSRKAGAPGHRRVTGNVVGRVYDTQRRRRRSLVEDYQ